MIKKTLTILLICATISGVSYLLGMRKAFDKISLEECWLNKKTRDVECIAWIH